MLSAISLLLVLAPTTVAPQELPSLDRLGVAWVRAGELDESVQLRLTEPELVEFEGIPLPIWNRFGPRLVVLGRWNDEARAAAEAQGIERVLVLDRARCKAAKPVTKEYADKQGRTARLRYTGAEWELEGSLCARELDWDAEWEFEDQGESQPPWGVSTEHLGEKVESEADPDAELAKAVRRAYEEALGRAGARLLWSTREAWLEPGDAGVSASTPWDWFGFSRRRPLPLASLSRRCRSDLTAWRGRWEAKGDTPPDAGRCEWCAAETDEWSSCSCAQATALEHVLAGARALISSGHGRERAELMKGMTGCSPRTASTHMVAIDAALAELPEVFRARLRAPDPRFANRGLVRVVIYADELPGELVDAFDEDLASCIDELAQYGGEGLERQLEGWHVKLQMPAAALIRIQGRNSRANAKVLERVNLRTAETSDLEGLFRKALEASLSPDE